MSIIWSSSEGWILCHSTYLNKLYKTLDQEICTDCGKYGIFHIHSPFLKLGQKYRKYFLEETDHNSFSNEAIRVCAIFQKLLSAARQAGVDYFDKRCPRTKSENGNVAAIDAANSILTKCINLNTQCFDGKNTNQHCIDVEFQEISYFIPPLCRFFCCCVSEFEEKLRLGSTEKYDVIVLDPPWWNKHVRRRNARTKETGYKMMYDEQLLKIPINSLLCSNGLVVVWCTNSQQHINYLIDEIFPVWKVEYVSSWYWMKVVEDGRPICEFSLEAGKKKPFERIIFASRMNRGKELQNPEPNKLIVSIPSAIHSHKPPLTEVLAEYLPSNAQCLELFARYLLPNWVSTGNDVLKLQQKRLYTS